MDERWFKKQQKKVGVTAEDIARRMGRTRSNVSNIYSGKQRMSLEWAQAFADTLEVSVDEVLRRAGVMSEPAATTLRPGFADSDAVPWSGSAAEQATMENIASCLGGGKSGIAIWSVKTNALRLNGLIPGDFILVNSNLADRCAPGDLVVAKKYDRDLSANISLIRRFEPPVLVACALDEDTSRVHVVDHDVVGIHGKIVACWRR